LPVVRYKIGDVDLVRDTAEIAVYYPRRYAQETERI
jgi:hypothetical protein